MKEGGFSLIELVVAIGILMILSTVTGSMAYSSFKTEQTQKAVQIATEAGYASALTQFNDFDDTDDKANIEKAFSGIGGSQVKLVINPKSNSKENLCVTGTWIGNKNDEVDPVNVGNQEKCY